MARIDFENYVPVPFVIPAVNIADELFSKGLECSIGGSNDVELVEAHKWFNLSALKGNKEALQYRQDIAEELDQMQIAKAQRAAREWTRLH
ncbi:MAG: hypothetical protein JKY32_13745 [Rhizobiales bacterium]|nr:hypothetical protein [Hyphomicrobiales bacterium]